MLRIRKQLKPPADWIDPESYPVLEEGPCPYDQWYSVVAGRNEYMAVKSILWEEQCGKCAYCERKLNKAKGKTSIEHLIPKSLAPELSLNYYNMVLVCKDQTDYCESVRGDAMIPPVVFYNNLVPTVNGQAINQSRLMRVDLSNGKWVFDGSASQRAILKETIDIVLKLNHSTLSSARRDAIDKLHKFARKKKASKIPQYQTNDVLFKEFKRVISDQTIEFRTFILISLAQKLGY